MCQATKRGVAKKWQLQKGLSLCNEKQNPATTMQWIWAVSGLAGHLPSALLKTKQAHCAFPRPCNISQHSLKHRSSHAKLLSAMKVTAFTALTDTEHFNHRKQRINLFLPFFLPCIKSECFEIILYKNVWYLKFQLELLNWIS